MSEMTQDVRKLVETPLTVEALLRVLTTRGCMTIAGYNGSCRRVVDFDALVNALKAISESNGVERVK